MRFLIWLWLSTAAPAAADPVPVCTPDERYDKPRPPSRPGETGKGLIGKTPREVEARLGRPSCASTAMARLFHPDGCAYEKRVVTVWFTRGKVTRVNAVDVITGEECM